MTLLEYLAESGLPFEMLVAVVAILAGGGTEVVKRTTVIDNKYLSLVSFAIGVVAAVALVPFTDLDIGARLWAGIIGGGFAVGVFEQLTTPYQQGGGQR